MKVLNLYAGIGGNRRNWKNCEVTAVEYDRSIAEVYKSLHPEDIVLVGDAHDYLLNHYNEFDFIWSSPPCQSHSSFRQNICVRFRGTEPIYPDMRLYQEILFLRYNFRGHYIVENVNPYYPPLIKNSDRIGRHMVWCNFATDSHHTDFGKSKLRTAQIPQLQEYHGVDLSMFKLKNKRQILRNCVDKEIGEFIFNCANEYLIDDLHLKGSAQISLTNV